jgi:dihydrolipoamide dehydrogenase
MPCRALAKATAAGDPNGFVKVLWHAVTGALVGAHLIGPADLIAEFTLAKTEVNAERHDPRPPDVRRGAQDRD